MPVVPSEHDAVKKEPSVEDGEIRLTKPPLEARLSDQAPMDVDGKLTERIKPPSGAKRSAEGSHEPRPPPADRQPPVAGPSRAHPQRPIGLPNKPQTDYSSKKAQKELEAFMKRKQQKNNLFIKK